MWKLIDKIMIFWAKLMKKNTKFMISWEKNFNEELERFTNLVVIFGHPKCKPCQTIMFKLPFYLYKLYKRKITMKFCNVKENSILAKNLGVQITPTLIYYKNWKQTVKIEDENKIFDFLKNWNK